MKNAKQNNILKYILIFAMVLCSLLFVEPRNTVRGIAYAEDAVQYSDVLSDLHKDSKFDESAYPENIKDYSISLITIAEGVDGDIFVYVYQPSGSVKDYRASSINISTSINNALTPFNKDLEYINSSGVFYKYKIKDLKVSDNNIRYYTIPSIYRPFDEQVDVKPSGDNTINEVAFSVSRQYAFGTVKGEPYVECVDIQTIEVTDKFVGFVRYKSGTNWYGATSIDSHFVAFTTDKPMDKLIEADVSYTYQDVWCKKDNGFFGLGAYDKVEYYDVKDGYVNLSYTDTYQDDTHLGMNFFNNVHYEWNRIQTVDDFLTEIDTGVEIYSGAVLNVSVVQDITNEARSKLSNKEWVLRFAETDYQENNGVNTVGHYEWGFTQVGAVTILRLKFETDGKVYNLGVIDNKQTGSDEPINPDWDKPFGGDVTVTLTPQAKETISAILIWLICLVVIMLLIPILKAIYSLNHSKHSTPKCSSSSTRRTKSSNKKPNKKTSKKR